MNINLNGLKLKNPITVASGTFGFGREYAEYIDLNEMGAVIVKGLTLKPKAGNPTPRIAETPMGILNSVGLENPGVEHFIKEEIPFLRQFDTKIIANINGENIEEYCEMARVLSNEDIDSIELNISCPNVKLGGLAFGTDPDTVRRVVTAVRKNCKKHLIVKLSPNVTNIKVIAKIVEECGADAISLINTVAGMAIDIENKKAILARKIGGLSGPAVKPIALRMVYEVYNAVDIPILGMGGIMNWKDSVEFIMAGATAISVGTANFTNPTATKEIKDSLEKYMTDNKIEDLKEIRGII